MPTNLLITYNNLLELLHRSHNANLASFRGVFNKDFADNRVSFRGLPVLPTPEEGVDTMDRQFRHLTTVVVNEQTRKREFETKRAIRLHWIKPHLEERIQANIIFFNVPDEKKTYILNKTERYVIILESKNNGQFYYLLTAYSLHDSGYKSIMNKFERRGVPI